MPTADLSPVIVLCSDHIGRLATNDGVVYYLTPCCGASAKGVESGVVCRSCYRSIDWRLADGWLASDADAWARWAQDFHTTSDRGSAQNAAILDEVIAAVKARAQDAQIG